MCFLVVAPLVVAGGGGCGGGSGGRGEVWGVVELGDDVIGRRRWRSSHAEQCFGIADEFVDVAFTWTKRI